MNLFELFIKIGAKDEASGEISALSEKLGNGLKTAAKIGTAAVTAATTGIAALTKNAVSNYAEYEQLVGGVDTLFKDSSNKVQQYAANAHKTAGISANQYMQIVTGFSASLLASLENDTEAAAEYADMAITDMSDNANKLGTDMELLENAYQGFAKGNYTMLDNLKLGYGGTKSEMERLIEDANNLKVANGEMADLTIADYADIVEAIHLIQTNMDITGTTAKEAGTTIQGSIGSMKSAWQDLLTGLADGNSGIETLVNNLITTIVGDGTETNLGVLGNILPAVRTALNGVGTLIGELVPVITEEVPALVTEILPPLLEAASGCVVSLAGALPTIISALVPTLASSIMQVIQEIIIILPEILSSLGEAISEILPGIISVITESIPLFVSGMITVITGLVKELPTIIEPLILSIPSLITSLIDAIVSNAPTLIDGVISLVMGIVDSLPTIISAFIEAIPTIIDSVCDGLVDTLPTLIDGVISLVMGIVDSLPTIISTLVEAIPTIIDSIVSAIVELLPVLVQCGMDLFLALIQALPQIITTIVKAIPQIITSIVSAIAGNLDQIIMAGVQLFVSLIENLPTIIIEIVKAIPEIIKGIVDAVIEAVPQMADAGLELIKGLWNGIKDSATWLWEKIRGWADELIGGIKGFFGIHSPSTVFAGLGKYMVEGLGNGIADNERYALNAIDNMSRAIEKNFDPTLNIGDVDEPEFFGEYDVRGNRAGRGGVSVVQNIYSQAKTAADLMQEALYQQERAVILGV